MIRVGIGIVCGMVIGAIIGHFGKCATGTCPLTGNPYVAAVYGGLMGALFTWPR